MVFKPLPIDRSAPPSLRRINPPTASIIPISWNEDRNTFTIGRRPGSFRAMVKKQIVRVVPVEHGRGAASDPEVRPDAVIEYTGMREELPVKKLQ